MLGTPYACLGALNVVLLAMIVGGGSSNRYSLAVIRASVESNNSRVRGLRLCKWLKIECRYMSGRLKDGFWTKVYQKPLVE